MANKSVLTGYAVNSIPAFILLLFLCLFAGGCETTAVLKNAAFYSCRTGNVYLSGWWNNVQDQPSIAVDPIGGYQFAYWVDDGGNVCHGDPGRNGQPGPAVITAFKPQAYNAAIYRSSITAEQLKSFQEIPVSFDNYSGSGLHFVQFYNTLWRARGNGETYKLRMDGMNSIPNVIEVGSKACVTPVAYQTAMMAYLSSPVSSVSSQDPNKCKARAMPFAVTMSADERKKYDVTKLPHGSEVYQVR